VVRVHTPEFTFEQGAGDIRTAVQSSMSASRSWTTAVTTSGGAFDNCYWPVLHLADDQGVIRYVPLCHEFGNRQCACAVFRPYIG
jgi:hypothetical protein